MIRSYEFDEMTDHARSYEVDQRGMWVSAAACSLFVGIEDGDVAVTFAPFEAIHAIRGYEGGESIAEELFELAAQSDFQGHAKRVVGTLMLGQTLIVNRQLGAMRTNRRGKEEHLGEFEILKAIALRDGKLSKKHLEITRTGRREVEVADKGSRNLTTVKYPKSSRLDRIRNRFS